MSEVKTLPSFAGLKAGGGHEGGHEGYFLGAGSVTSLELLTHIYMSVLQFRSEMSPTGLFIEAMDPSLWLF